MRTIPALYMRGGTSKRVFFKAADLPPDPAERDAVLLRVLGSPDPYGKQSDGMGGATSSTSKVVLLAPSTRPGFEVDYRFGAVAIGAPLIDWYGNCGNLSAAVGPAAILMGMAAAHQGVTVVNIWQANIGQHIVARVPVENGAPRETGGFREDGVAFDGAELVLEFIESEQPTTPLLPTGNIVDRLEVPGVGWIEATLVTAGNPSVFIDAAVLGLDGTELPDRVNLDGALLARCEAIRAHAAVRMGLAADAAAATRERPATPRVSWVAPPAASLTSAGLAQPADAIDILARIVSMGKCHHAYAGTGAIALAVAAALPGSVVARCLDPARAAGSALRIGHPSGRLAIGASVRQDGSGWRMERASLSRSARVLMSGQVHLP
jgi:probable AcnD-accessory protein PrpF